VQECRECSRRAPLGGPHEPTPTLADTPPIGLVVRLVFCLQTESVRFVASELDWDAAGAGTVSPNPGRVRSG
jgi:hypothetical protein